jgi:hypothetical protein
MVLLNLFGWSNIIQSVLGYKPATLKNCLDDDDNDKV